MKQLQVLLVFIALISLVACGGKSVTITLTPTTVTVATSQSQQFTATVTNASNSAVTWEVNGIIGGNSATVGSITSGGYYTAPTTVPNPSQVTITALPTADTKKQATATLTVVLGANLSISPSSVTVGTGGQQTFYVTSNGAAISGQTFTLSCQSSVAGACGSVSSTDSYGIYTAPSTPPPGGTVILTVHYTNASGTFTTSASITVQASAQTTAGQYAFTLAGNGNGAPYYAAGSFTFDGAGHVTTGAETVNANGTVSTLTLSGTYTFSSTDQRVNVTVTDQNSVTRNFYLAFANLSNGFIEYNGSNTTASGSITQQVPAQFNLAAVSGSYCFRLTGMNPGSPATGLAEVGAFSANGTGGVTGGLLDANSGGTVSSSQAVTAGSLTTPDANGSGTLTVTSSFAAQTFTYYVIDGTHLKLVETDATHLSSGDALLQAGLTSGVQGNVAVILNGVSANGTLGIGGLISLVNGTFGGSLDINNAGVFQAGQTLGGTYSVTDATTGRTAGTITISGSSVTIPIVAYPISATTFNVLDADPANVAVGPGVISSGTNTLNGNFATNLTGVFGTTPEDVVGVLNANGGGAFTGTLNISIPTGHTATTLQSSPYSISGTPNATLKSGASTFSSIGFNMYIVDATQVFFLENDNQGVLTGTLLSQ
jgi:hypothetical protein